MATVTRIEIRPADAAERDRIQAIWDEAGLGRTAPDEWDALMSGDTAVVLVAVDDQDIVGTAIAAFDGWRAYIYHVAVAGTHRRKGIGHQLMDAAEQYLLSTGARHVFVMVNDENTEALALVGATGYIPEGEIVLTKRLATRFA